MRFRRRFQHPQKHGITFVIVLGHWRARMAIKLIPLKHLPASMTRGMGRLLVADSYLDLVLIQIVYDLTGVSQKEGRLAIREPRTIERLDMIVDLAHIHKVAITTNLKLLREAIVKSSSNRDLISHGIWFREPQTGRFLVRRLRGFWPKGKDGSKLSRRTMPQGEPIDEDELAVMLAISEAAIEWVEDLHAEVKAGLATSPRKHL